MITRINEFKKIFEFIDNEQFLIQSWFKKHESDLIKWFATILQDLKFYYFEYDKKSNNGIYVAELHFSDEENNIKYILTYIIEEENITNGNFDKLPLQLKAYTEDNLINTLSKEVSENEISSDLIVQLIDEFNQLYMNDKENTEGSEQIKKLENEIANENVKTLSIFHDDLIKLISQFISISNNDISLIINKDKMLEIYIDDKIDLNVLALIGGERALSHLGIAYGLNFLNINTKNNCILYKIVNDDIYHLYNTDTKNKTAISK